MLVINDEAFRSAMRRALDYLEASAQRGEEVVHLAMDGGQLHVTHVHPDAGQFYSGSAVVGPGVSFDVWSRGAA